MEAGNLWERVSGWLRAERKLRIVKRVGSASRVALNTRRIEKFLIKSIDSITLKNSSPAIVSSVRYFSSIVLEEGIVWRVSRINFDGIRRIIRDRGNETNEERVEERGW